MSIESILGAVLVFFLVIFVHELGHFLVAKWCDVEIHTFSMGFGYTVWSRRWGETEYRLAALPLGGYVKMAGEDGGDAPHTRPDRGFAAKPLWQRSAIVAAGPAVNILFAFLIFSVAFFAYGEKFPVEAARIGGVMENEPAARAGLIAGDEIVAVDGEPVASFEALSERVRSSAGKTLTLRVMREGREITVEITASVQTERDHLGEEIGKTYRIGIQRAFESRPVGLFESIGLGARYTWGFTSMIFETVARLVQGRLPARELGGPIMIAQEAGRAAANGLEPLLRLMALISVNLGVINVLPIPVLDGGHLLFFLVEAIRRRPVSIRSREVAMQVGVVVLGALMVFVFFNDIVRILNDVTRAGKG